MGTIATMNVALKMDDRDFSAGIARAQASAESFSKKLGNIGTSMSLAVTAPMVGIATMAIKSAADFESNMNVMQAVTGATTADMAAMQQQALDLGASTSFSAGEAAEAMVELGKAGLEPLEIMAAMPGVLNLAAAGNLDVASAATIAANAVNTFGLEASKATEIADLLAATANASSSDVTDLAQGFANAGAVFASLGQGADVLATSIALMSNAGVGGAEAGTQLKSMLLAITTPTDNARRLMKELGIAVYDSTGTMRPLVDIIGSVEKATEGMADAQRIATMETLFGAYGITAATILTEAGAEGFTDMTKAVNEAGAAEKAAAARMKGLNGAIDYLMGSIDSILITLGTPFLTMLGDWAIKAADLATSFTTLPPEIQNTALAIAGILAAAGPVLLVVSKLIPVFGMLGTVLGVLASPIGLIVVAIGALTAAFATDFMGIRTTVVNAIKPLSPIFEGLYDVLIKGEEPLGDWGYWWEQMSAVIGGDAAAIISDITGVADSIVDAFARIVSGDFSGASNAIKGMGESLSWLWKDIQSVDWGGAIAALGEKLNAFRDSVVAKMGEINWSGALDTAGGWLNDLKTGIVSAIQSIPWGAALGTTTNLFGLLVGWISAKIQGIDWGGMLTTAGKWLDGLKNGVISAVTGIPWLTLLATAGNFLAGIGQGVKNRLITINWGGVLAEAGTWLDNLKNGVVAAIKGIGWAEALTTAFASLELAVTAALSALGLSGAATALDSLKTAFTALPTAINEAKAAFSSLWEKLSPVVTQIIDFFTPAIERLQAAFTALPEKLGPLLPKLVALGESFGELAEALAPFVALVGWGLAIAVELGINRLTTVFETLPDLLGPIIDHLTATIRLISSVLRTTVAVVKAIFDGSWATAWESAQETANEFNEFFRGLFSRLGTFMSAVAHNISDPIIDTLKTLGTDIVAPFNALYKVFEEWWSNIVETFAPVMDAIEAVRAAIAAFVSYVNGLSISPPWQNWGAPPALGGGANPATQPGSGVTSGVPAPQPNVPSVPNNQNFDPYGSSGGITPASVVVNNYGPIGNQIDLNELAYKVAQANQRRFA